MKPLTARVRYILIGVGVFLTLAVTFFLRGLFRKEKPDGTIEDMLPAVEEGLKEKVRAAEEAALVARVEARVEADTKREELAEISQIDDGAERRKRLAAMLRGL
jgi:hypothetical protein